ncbi:MAG: Autotransporter-associated beta strand repeat protein [Myxococcaceae bacterium]|nr:Autotransporter-associated beta strand repeat protein [Myxococcaceae bacterium]
MRVVGWALSLVLIAACGDFTSGADPAANDSHPPGAIDGGGDATEASALAGGIKVSLVDEGFIVQGSSSAVRIKVERTGSFAGPVNLSFSGLPPNVAVMAGTAAPSDVEASVVVTVPASLAQGKLTATLDATSADGTIAVSQAVSLYVRGKPGTLDPTFGQGGAVDIADPALYVQPTAIGVDAGGRVVVSLADGHSNVLRLTPAGLPDGSFGMNGVAHVDDLNRNVAAIAISDQGRVVVVDAVAAGSRIVRLTSTGGLDTSFGVMGEMLPAYPGIASHLPRRCALLPDERLLLAEAAGTNWLVALFDVKGALEPTFGGSGYVTQSWPPPGASSPSSEISTLTLEPGGGIFLAGAAHYGPSGARADEMALTELSTTGSLVQGALGGGTLRVPLSDAARAGTIPLDARALSDGRFALAGAFASTVTARRVKSDGTKDSTFGTDGAVDLTPFPGSNVDGLRFADDGSFILTAVNAGALVLRKFDAKGGVDVGFAAAGSLTLPARGVSFIADVPMVLQGQRVVMAAQYNKAGSGTGAVLFRVWL